MEQITGNSSDMNVFDHINNRYFHMTKAEKRVADYVMAHRLEPQYMSISELAIASKVAEATISRFCRNLGLKGYNAFKLELAKATVAHDSGAPSMGDGTAEVTIDDSVQSMCEKLFVINSDALKQTLSFVETADIQTAAELLLNADQVYCMGQGGSLILAEEAYSLFLTVSPKFHSVCDSHLQAITASLLTKRDVVLFFSYSGATKELMDISQIVAERGTKLILVSRFPKSPGAEFASVVLKCGSNESPLRSGSVAARMAQLYIIDMLYNQMVRMDQKKFVKNREMTASALTNKLL